MARQMVKAVITRLALVMRHPVAIRHQANHLHHEALARHLDWAAIIHQIQHIPVHLIIRVLVAVLERIIFGQSTLGTALECKALQLAKCKTVSQPQRKMF